MSPPTQSELLAAARCGDVKSLGRLLEFYRDSLRAQAADQLNARLNARVDPSDIVQETFLEAHRDFDGFRGECEAEWAGWLNQILVNNIAEAVRRHDRVKKRTVRAERSIDDSHLSGIALRHLLAADDSSPSHRAMRAELFAELSTAVETLTPDQREAIRLRYVERNSLAQVAEHLGRSESAAASLLKRAFERLRHRFADDHAEDDHAEDNVAGDNLAEDDSAESVS